MAELTHEEVVAIQAQLGTMTNRRIQILTSLNELLKTITKDRGYKSEVFEVSFDVKSWRDKVNGQCPVIFIIDDTTKITRHAGCVREYDWSVSLFCVLRDVDTLELENFISDVEQCVYDNNTLFGIVNKVEFNEIITDNQLFSMIEGAHLVEFSLGVEYTRSARNTR